MGEVNIVVPPDSESDISAFNALVIALKNKKMYAVVKYVSRANTDEYYFIFIRKLAAWIPDHQNNVYSFIMVNLPTKEQIKHFSFKTLDQTN
jgi:hypothetical protein